MVRNAAQRDTVEGAGATAVRGDLARDTVDELAQ
jgi:hypothetical protein